MIINVTNYVTLVILRFQPKTHVGIAGCNMMCYILVFSEFIATYLKQYTFFVYNWELYLAIIVSANVPAFKDLDHQQARRLLQSWYCLF